MISLGGGLPYPPLPSTIPSSAGMIRCATRCTGPSPCCLPCCCPRPVLTLLLLLSRCCCPHAAAALRLSCLTLDVSHIVSVLYCLCCTLSLCCVCSHHHEQLTVCVCAVPISWSALVGSSPGSGSTSHVISAPGLNIAYLPQCTPSERKCKNRNSRNRGRSSDRETEACRWTDVVLVHQGQAVSSTVQVPQIPKEGAAAEASGDTGAPITVNVCLIARKSAIYPGAATLPNTALTAHWLRTDCLLTAR